MNFESWLILVIVLVAIFGLVCGADDVDDDFLDW